MSIRGDITDTYCKLTAGVDIYIASSEFRRGEWAKVLGKLMFAEVANYV